MGLTSKRRGQAKRRNMAEWHHGKRTGQTPTSRAPKPIPDSWAAHVVGLSLAEFQAAKSDLIALGVLTEHEPGVYGFPTEAGPR